MSLLLLSLVALQPALAQTTDTTTLAERVAARVNDALIFQTSVEEEMRRAELRRGGGVPPTNPRPAYDESLDALIDEELLYQAATDATAVPSVATLSALVEDVVAELEREFGGTAALADALRRQGDSLAAFKQRLQVKQERDYRIHRAISARVALTDDEVTSYEAELRRAGIPTERYSLAHILIRCDDAPTSTARASAEAGAESRAYEALGFLAKGKYFDDVARMMSDDAYSAAIGGFLGFVDQGSFAPALEAAIRELQVGEVSRPVRGPNGYHVFKLLDRQSARDKLYRQKFDAERTRWLSELRTRAYTHRLPNPYE